MGRLMPVDWPASGSSTDALTAALREAGWALWWSRDALRLTAPDGQVLTVSESTTRRTLVAGYEAARDHAMSALKLDLEEAL